jgi:hypothetical protein
LIAPSGDAVVTNVAINQAKRHTPVAGQPPIAAVIHCSNPSNFTAGSCMALVAVRATLPGFDAPLAVVAPYGVWQLEFSLGDDADDLVIDAWIERDDTFDGRWPNRQSHFLSTLPPLANHAEDDAANPVKREATSNSITHGSYSVVVGGYVKVDGELAMYKSAGRDGAGATFSYPTVLFPSDVSQRLEGIPAAGSQSGVQSYMNGTSVAAPQAARWALNYLAGLPPRTHFAHLDTWLEVVNAIGLSADLMHAPPRRTPPTVQNLRQGIGSLP